MSLLVSPSILSGNFANLIDDIEMLNSSEADWIHVDIMDGVFVPNISFGFPVMEAINKHTLKPLDVHLMIVDPDRYIRRFKEAGANILTVHLEACRHLHRTIQSIVGEGMKAGVALNPHSAVNDLEDIIQDIELILVMSVNPGFGGQKFIENTYRKVERVKNLIEKTGAKTRIEVDGGVNLENAPKLADVGVDVVVAGNAIFNSPDPIATIAALKAGR
ncbi:MAG TPA: ribulose-phosphate 3-epimerase [Cryomorphaceae bacterium]|nr:ribulose-phosphate 3-epimerase [Cryomorphaceae bacterium]